MILEPRAGRLREERPGPGDEFAGPTLAKSASPRRLRRRPIDGRRLQRHEGLPLMRQPSGDEPGGLPVFTIPTALSLMVFFALCCQCASTLAVIRRETGSWRWPLFTFAYMTALAYVGALAVYQVSRLFI